MHGNFFKGELYIDVGKKSYSALKFKRYNIVNIWASLLAKVARNAVHKAKAMKIDSNLSGDGFQNGGLLVVEAKGENILFEFSQDNPADHVANAEIQRALSLEVIREGSEEATDKDYDCEDACSIPVK